MQNLDKFIYKTLGSKLKESRINKGLSLRDVSSDIGVNFKKISRIENGEAKVDIETIKLICSSLGVDYIEVARYVQNEFNNYLNENKE